jgi:hypothetical protein
LLDIVIQITVFGMNMLIAKGTGTGDAIAMGWKIFRDLANLGLIGGLVWASIAMIIQLGGTIKPGKIITDIIIVALLVNFSYFFAGVIIDASNSLSLQLYRAGLQGTSFAMSEGALPLGGIKAFGGQFSNGEYDTKFSEIFLSQTRLITIWDKAALTKSVETSKASEDWNLITILIFAAFLFSTAIAAFMTIAFLLIGRFVILVFLLITAPIGMMHFSGIPTVSKWGEQWWKTLIHQCIFPPVFFLLAMISFRIMEGFVKMDSARQSPIATFADLVSLDFARTSEAVGMLLIYCMAWGFLWASMSIAKSIAQEAADKLPTSADIQKYAVGAADSKFAKGVANAPVRVLTNYLIGYPMKGGKWAAGKGREALGDLARGVGRATGGDTWLEDTMRGIGNHPIVRAFTGKTKGEVEAEERRRNKPLKEIGEANTALEAAQGRARAAQDILDNPDSTPEARAAALSALSAANSDIKAAKEKVKQGWRDYYKTNGAQKTADQIKGLQVRDPKTGKMRPATEEEQNAVIDMLEDKDADDVAAAMKFARSPRKKEEGGGGGKRASTGADQQGGASQDAGNADVVAAIRELKPELQGLARGTGNLTTALVSEFNELEVGQRRALILMREDLVADRNIAKGVTGAPGSAERQQFGKVLVDVATHAPERLAREDHAHLAGYQGDMARHMTPEAYGALRGHYQEDSPIMHSIHGHMRREGTGNIIDGYNSEPGGRV